MSLVRYFLLHTSNTLMSVTTTLAKLLGNCGHLCSKLNSFLATPAIVNQILGRSFTIKSQVMKSSQDEMSLTLWNVRCLILLDTLVGLIVMVMLLQGNICEEISEVTVGWADTVVVLLNRLLNWLLGVPAGLKLNSPLNQFLGRFFHYHIYLWTGYLSLLKPALVYLIQVSAMIGVLGFTQQLCFFQDIFSALTLHIYCFYVYAARLYYFQVYALSSLWRLFRGRKWNVLRCRVDLASYDVDQLFVGTILFTILLFLLPTTALYYFVFLSLRLLVVFVNGAMAKVVTFLNDLPVYVLLLRLVASDTTSCKLYHEVEKKSGLVAVKTSQLSYLELYRLYGKQTSTTKTTSDSWGHFMRKIFLGQLIYPWNNS